MWPTVPSAPKNANSFIIANTTSALLKLDVWDSNGCDIKYFVVKYKLKSDNEWNFVSSHISPQQKYIELVDLMPAKWYSLNVNAFSDAGNTEQQYNFATLTPSGGIDM